AAIGPERALLNVLSDIPVRAVRRNKVQVAAHPGRTESCSVRAGKQETIVVVVIVHQPGERELAMVVHAGDALGLLFGLAQRRKEEAGQDGNDGDYHQQLNEREGGSGPPEPVGRIDFRTWHFTTPVVARQYPCLIVSSTSFLAERNEQETTADGRGKSDSKRCRFARR